MITCRLDKPMTADQIEQWFIRLLEDVNDETVSEASHRIRVRYLYEWRSIVKMITGLTFNGDYHYIELGIDRPMCCGEFLDWQEKTEGDSDE